MRKLEEVPSSQLLRLRGDEEPQRTCQRLLQGNLCLRLCYAV